MSDRRSFLLRSTAAVAGLLLPSQLRGYQAGNSAASSQGNLALTGGHWFDGQTFRDHTTDKHTVYSASGYFTSKKPARIDAVIDLKNWFVVPPFGEAHNHNADFPMKSSGRELKGCTCAMEFSTSRTQPIFRVQLLPWPAE